MHDHQDITNIEMMRQRHVSRVASTVSAPLTERTNPVHRQSVTQSGGGFSKQVPGSDQGWAQGGRAVLTTNLILHTEISTTSAMYH